MRPTIRRMLAVLTVGTMLISSAALADSISFEGSVTAKKTCEVYMPIGGTVASVEATEGQQICAGDVLARLETSKIYAQENGTVTGIFGEAGDNAETVAEKYGAVMYIEGESVYTVSASTEKAYDATDNKFVHVGETVKLKCYSDGDHTGSGVVTAVSGTDYTVEVTEGKFMVGETVNVYRSSIKAANRIGRGTLTRRNPTAVTASGSIVSLAVENGDSVRKGDLLFETLEGSFDGLYMSGSDVRADVDGVLAQMNLAQGNRTEKDSVAAVLYPADAMQIEAQVEEANLSAVAVGDKVSIELIWNQDEEVLYDGVISMISAIANSQDSANGEGSASVTYNVYIDFTPDEHTRYGMSAVVSTMDDAPEDEIIEETEDEPQE